VLETKDMARLLEARFNSDSTSDLDATIEFDWGTGRLSFGIHADALTIYHDPEAAPSPEFVLYFDDIDLAHGIFAGTANPIEAFMQGHFRSDSNLIWVFHTLGAFSKAIPK
jgi:putative sterol carrier protein